MRTVLRVPDISCAHCTSVITEAVSAVQGVRNVDVQIDQKLVVVDGDFSDAAVVAVIIDAGYEVADRV